MIIRTPSPEIENRETTSDGASGTTKVTPDPPPPYPDQRKRHSKGTSSASTEVNSVSHHHQRVSSIDSNESPSAQQSLIAALNYPDEDNDEDENAHLLSSRSAGPRGIVLRDTNRRSRPSVVVKANVAPSLRQTAYSLFAIESRMEGACDDEDSILWPEGNRGGQDQERRAFNGLFSASAWKRYFKPMASKAYYMPLVHILFIDFYFAILAWAHLFTFTLCGTVLLMVPPVGILFCFFDLVCGRALARAEIAMQKTFHGPLAHSIYPIYPIFTRLCAPTDSEAGFSDVPRYERSFYKNSRSMFTDSTSYQALFYFLVIKPGISFILFLLAWTIVPASFVLILPFPAVMRAMRKLGIWQANIAMDGLYLPV